MRVFFICGLIFAAVGAAVLAVAQPPEPRPGTRVLLRVNRNLEVAGHIASEDDDVITVRNLKGEIESFPKSRIAQIVRLVDPQPGQIGIVVLRGGEVREGIVIEDTFEHVLMEIPPGGGIRAKLKRELVSHVVLQPSFDERYAEYKAALQPGMYDAHFVLCKWLFEQRRYDLAAVELTDLLEKTEMAEARKLLNIVQAQLALTRTPPRRPAKPEPSSDDEGDDAEPETDGDAGASGEARTLSAGIISRADVNLIRVYEIDFDRPPKVTITPDTVRAIIDKYATSKQIPASQTGRNAMFRAAADKPLDVVRLLFELRAREMYPEIRVNTEPYSLNLFRQRIHDTWLMNNCATSRCHGGPDAGRFFLHRKNHKDDRVRYTNLLILERLRLDPEWPLINYEKPEDSLIIQYGLSREDGMSRKPHPKVPGWKAAFSSISPRMKHDAIEWINSMMQPRPNYPVDYVPTPPPPEDDPAEDSDSNRPPR